MNKAIAVTITLLFIIMLLTTLSAVWLDCWYLTAVGGIGAIITMLCLHDTYAIKARKRRRYERIWKQIQEQERYKRMTADELFRSYTASEWR